MVLAPAASHAGAADEFVGLFVQGCLPFVGNPPALRDWAKRIGLPPVPEQVRTALLHGAPGQAFDASVPEAKLVLLSSDDGLCSAITARAMQQQVSDALAAGLRQAGLDFRLVIEHDDASVGAIHNREYLAAKNKRGWRILEATVKGDKGGEAMLTAAPE